MSDRAFKSASLTGGEVTRILAAAQNGDPKAAGELLPLVYEELRRLAAHRLAGERRQHTLQPTALVHEAWLKISSDEQRVWNGRQHFFAAAAEAMRRILVDRARRRLAAKRGAGEAALDVDELEILAPAPDDELLLVSEAMEQFALLDPRKAECKEETEELQLRLGRYMTTFMVVPGEQMHVNLSPFEEGCGIPEPLRRTELGLAMLEQDFELKKFTAGLLHPLTETGNTFWNKIKQSSLDLLVLLRASGFGSLQTAPQSTKRQLAKMDMSPSSRCGSKSFRIAITRRTNI